MKKKSLKRGLITSALSIFMMLGIMVGTSLAWFNVVYENQGARIQAGNLAVEFLADEDGDFSAGAIDLATSEVPVFVFPSTAQPGDTVTRHLKVTNKGSIALDYEVLFRVVNDTGLGEAIDVKVDKLTPVTSSETFTGVSINNEILEHSGSGMVQNASETYEITLTFNQTAGMDFQGKSYSLDLLMVAWQFAYQDSKPVYVSTLAELQDAAGSVKKGQTVVLLENIDSDTTDITFNQLINLDLKGHTLRLKSLTVYSDDNGFMRFSDGTLVVDTYTINTPNAELTHALDFTVNASVSVVITASSNSYILLGTLDTVNLSVLGNTSFKPQASSELVVTGTITKAETANITPVSGAILSVPLTESSTIETVLGVVVAQKVVKAGQSIQAAIDAANDGDTIFVEFGDYKPETTLVINKAINLYGPNWEISGISDQRKPEANILLDFTNTYAPFRILADNVVVSGFKIQENQEFLIDKQKSGINVFGGFGKNTAIRNNIIDGDFPGYGSIFASGQFYDGTRWVYELSRTNLLIEHNLLSNGGYIYYQGSSGIIRNNTITEALVGMQIQPYGNVNDTLVEHNTIESYLRGIWFNYANKGAGTTTIQHNTITATDIEVGNPSLDWDGIRVQTYATEGTGADPMLKLLDNTIDGAGSVRNTTGFRTVANTSLSGQYEIEDNEFKNVQYGFSIYSAATFSDDIRTLVTNNTFSAVTNLSNLSWQEYADTSWYGDGSATTYIVSTASELAGLAKLVNEGTTFLDKTIELGNNINLLNIDWTPIGFDWVTSNQASTDKPFRGVFDGKDFTISNLKVSEAGHNYVGLFGAVNGTIKNLIVNNAVITGQDYVGTVVGNINGSIENIQVKNANTTGNHFVGGVAGLIQGYGSSTSQFITMKNVSIEDSVITGLYNTAINDDGDKVGGIAGYMRYARIQGATVDSVTVTGYRDVGGVVGAGATDSKYEIKDVSITDSIVQATLQGQAGHATPYAGTIIGRPDGSGSNVLYLSNANVENTTVTSYDQEFAGNPYSIIKFTTIVNGTMPE